MEQTSESSVLFSLDELMTIEQERLQIEERQRAARAEWERQQARLQEKARARAKAEELRREEKRRDEERRRKKEEEARLEAIVQARVVEARERARRAQELELLEQRQKLELELVEKRKDQKPRSLRRALAIVGGLAVLTASGFGFALHEQHAQSERLLSVERGRLDEVQRKTERQLDQLEAQLERQQNAARAEEPAQPKSQGAEQSADEDAGNTGSAQPQKEAFGHRRVGSARPDRSEQPSQEEEKPTHCLEGDPMCTDL